MSNRFLEIQMSNKPNDNLVSYRKGMSDLIFQIPAMNSTLIPGSVRLVGKLRVKKGDGTVIANTDDIHIDSRLGVWGCFSTLTTRSIKHQQTIENIRHYSHFLKSYLPLSTKSEDNLGHLDESGLVINNYDLNYISNVVKSSANNTGNSFCVPLPCGLLNGTRHIPLSDSMLSGLEIKLSLAPDTQVLYAVDGTIGDNQAFYELDDLKLICEVRDYTDQEIMSMAKQSQGVFTYQSVSSYYDTINSANAQVNFNLGLSKVRSAWASFIPSTFLNSMSNNGYASLMPTINTNGQQASIKKVVWTKGGALYPKMFDLNNNIRDAPDTSMCDPVLTRDYVSCVVPFVDNHSTMVGVGTCNRLWTADNTATDKLIPYTKLPDSGLVWGIGMNYDALGGSGEDFRTQNLGINIELDLTEDNPISTFIFVNSEQSVAFNNNGIQVIQ